jgi:hypothetical protein
MKRHVVAEALDGLAAHDPAALRSRRDLRRIHRFMGTRSILLRALDAFHWHATAPARPLRMLELGAGDGTLMLGVARSWTAPGNAVELTLLDRQFCVAAATLDDYAAAGWTTTACVADVASWIAGDVGQGGGDACWDLIVINLFLHHFRDGEVRVLLAAIAARTERLLACEPRRGWLALGASHLVGALGANRVTRQDAVLSVRAGFSDRELTALWPSTGAAWRLHEQRAGAFSHCFRAERCLPA